MNPEIGLNAMRLRRKFIVGIEILLWWALMVGVWDVTLSGTTVPDISAAAGAGLLSAIAAVAARVAIGGRWRADVRWVRWLPVWAMSVAVDTGAVLALAGRHLRRPVRGRDVHGAFTDIALAKPEFASEDAHRALATMALSSTPGTLVYDAEPEDHRLLVHRIVDTKPGLERTVSR